ncbi:hypothetical protein A8924_5739 [Saccharopolyspora erythraea NRRL 2338]|uniref:Uncharacterized protein n=1 Tax=Saccharopolyspora erythraea TaxID=1836 RepID=A0ABN1EFK2_SACER|nr:hypothetical protein [Saccharopolyspora erythraea]PFG98233.1 hypothetical protein A8924_5739 [Saccharopolyspora erythraea NRRL 2338]
MECWFCDAPASPADRVDVVLSRDRTQTFIVIGFYETWRQTYRFVPRCRRCRNGHGLERGLRRVLIGSAAFTGLMLLPLAAGNLSGEPWKDQWLAVFPVLLTLGLLMLWWGVLDSWFGWHRLAPRPERYALEHPAVQEMFEEGWGGGTSP